jgi:hypothetical protein
MADPFNVLSKIIEGIFEIGSRIGDIQEKVAILPPFLKKMGQKSRLFLEYFRF